jgi:hypothetical protein
MDLEIFKKSDPSGSMCKEKSLLKTYPKEYEYIIDYCINNELGDLPFKEKVFISVNNLKEVPKCKNNNCSNKVKYKNSTIGYLTYCSNKCISSDENIKKSKQEKSIVKYGTKTPAESLEIKQKIIKTNLEKYGVNSAMCLEKTQEKSKQTLLKNWGVDNPNKSEELNKKRIESFKISDFKENFKKTSIEKYGVEHHWMIKEIHDKSIDVFYSDYKKRIMDKINQNDYEFNGFNKNITTYLKFFCKKCNTNFEILTYQFYYRVTNNTSICTNCFPISESSSIKQIDIYNFIKENYNGEIIVNTKDYINPYEIDIYLPELKLGFEFNGLYWHSEKFKKEEYHLIKKQLAEKNNINLFTIWEDDWVIKKEICKSYILNKLNLTYKIGARKCVIKEVDYTTSKNFLDRNHFQGDCKSSIRIGLYYNNELVNLMTFSKLRLPLGGKNQEHVYELTRYCNIINTNIIGGASKLLKYFIDKWIPIRIETYSDNLISNGNMYEKLGFTYLHTSKPGYWYVIDKKREHRFNWRKSKLVKMGYDINKTEEEIMLELGYYRVYNGGNKKWIFLL